MYFEKLASLIYYMCFVFCEFGIRTSKWWPPIVSITGIISLILTLPLLSIIPWCTYTLYGFDVNLDILIPIIFCFYILIDKILTKYYRPIHRSIEKRYLNEKIFIKFAYSLIIFSLIGLSFLLLYYFNNKLTELQIQK